MLRFLSLVVLGSSIASGVSAQSMTYSGNGYKGETSVIEGAGTYQDKSRTFLDSELDLLPSRLTLERWGESHRDFFDKYDVDGDGVWSELDLVEYDDAEVKDWASRAVQDIFSFWHPNRSSHMKSIEMDLKKIAKRNDFLAATVNASSSIQKSLDDIGLLGSKSSPMFIEAIPQSGVSVTRSGRVADKSRSWSEVSVPFLLKMTNGSQVSEARYTAHIIAMQRFPVFEGDVRWALWNIALSSE